MTTTRRLFALVAGMAALMALMFASNVTAAYDDHGTPDAADDHMMATPSGSDGMDMSMSGTGVVYMTITNDGGVDEELVSASTDRSSAVEIHETIVENEVGRMMPLDGPLVIPVGESVSLEPGGLHVMLVGLTDDIQLGDTFEVTLTFAEAGDVTIPVTAVLDAEDAEGDPVTGGNLTIEGVWSRPAPMIDGMNGTPMATPES